MGCFMNRDFKIVDNKVIVHTDNKGTVIKEVTNNIEDILICENNIEEIDDKIRVHLAKIKKSKIKMKSSWSDIGLSALWLFNFILNSTLGNWFAASCHILCSICWFSKGYFGTIKPELKFIKATNRVIKELEDNLNKENEKLNELSKDKSNDLMYFVPSKTIDKSQQIINLKRKLDVIYSFEMHKQKLINCYKKGILKEKELIELGFNNDDYDLLEELIKNNLSKKEEKEIGNAKVLNRR